MVRDAVAFLLAAAVGLVGSARLHADAGQAPSCPDEVFEDPSGRCLDTYRSALPDSCCADWRSCRVEVEEMSKTYEERLRQYAVTCSIPEDHVAMTEEGLRVVNLSAVCSEGCRARASSLGADVPGYGPIGERCGRFRIPGAEAMEQGYARAAALRDALQACTAMKPRLMSKNLAQLAFNTARGAYRVKSFVKGAGIATKFVKGGGLAAGFTAPAFGAPEFAWPGTDASMHGSE